MDIFSRTVTLQGSIDAMLSAATDMRSYVSDKIGQEVGLWSVGLGAPLGTLTFTTTVDGLAGAAAMNQTFMGDAGYESRAAALRALMVAPTETTIMSPIHGQPGDGRPPIGSVATVTTAVAAGRYDEVVGFGIELSQHVESVTGMPIMFGNAMAGTFGEFTWIGVAADAAAADDANAKLLADPKYIDMISGAVSLFVPGQARRMIGTRIA